jgi:hypothetical protein
MQTPLQSVGINELGKAPDLMALVSAGPMSQAICVAAELRLAELLADGPRTAAELAQATGSHPPSLHRLLRALASLGLCSETCDGTFEVSATGSLLRGDAPNSLRSWTIWCGRHMWPAWARLRDSVRTGKSAQLGASGFGDLERDAQAAAAFNGAMVELTRQIAREVVRSYDFAGIRRIVDVGGGHGALLTAILADHPGMQGVIFDLPHAIAGAKTYLADEAVSERCELIAGDFFASLPGDADAYLLKNIIHDWDDERAALILRNCRRAMQRHGKLLLIEQVSPGRLEASPAHRAIAWIDLAMLIGQAGRQRTEAEICALLAASGLAHARTLKIALDYSIIECVNASKEPTINGGVLRSRRPTE